MINHSPEQDVLKPLQKADTMTMCLNAVLDLCRNYFSIQDRCHTLEKRFYVKSSLSSAIFTELARCMRIMEINYPKHLEPVFEDPHTLTNIRAKAWAASSILGGVRNDAIIRMSFDEKTNNLPLHVHEFSDRVLIVEAGSGYGYFNLNQPNKFKTQDVKRVDLNVGDVIVFRRNTMHTFESEQAITTITYHSPFIPFNHSESFEKIIEGADGKGWYPSMFNN